MKGSFEEQMTSLIQAVGGKPILTQNEARAHLNAPRSMEPGTDSLEPPANIAGGEMGARQNEAEPAAVNAIVRSNLERQQARLEKVPVSERADLFARTLTRWDKELTQDLQPLFGDKAERFATSVNGQTLAMLNAGKYAEAFAADRVSTE
jgi:hypothetical protein